MLALAACSFGGGRPVLEQVSPNIPGTKFKVIATITGGDARTDIRMSVTVREQLNDSGWTAVRRAGRWESRLEALSDICSAGDVDGVLIVLYNRLELDDCATQKPAYAIDASYEQDVGLTEMVRRLMRYLRGERTAAPGGGP